MRPDRSNSGYSPRVPRRAAQQVATRFRCSSAADIWTPSAVFSPANPYTSAIYSKISSCPIVTSDTGGSSGIRWTPDTPSHRATYEGYSGSVSEIRCYETGQMAIKIAERRTATKRNAPRVPLICAASLAPCAWWKPEIQTARTRHDERRDRVPAEARRRPGEVLGAE